MRKISKRTICQILVFSVLICLLFGEMPDARGQTFISGKVITADGMVVASGVVALERGELHNNAFLAGGAIESDGTFKIPLPSGGPWGLHVYSKGYIYFPLQVQIEAGVDNEVPVILPLDGQTEDDPRISDFRFDKISDQVFQIRMKVDDPDKNLGPQMLAVDTSRFRLPNRSGDWVFAKLQNAKPSGSGKNLFTAHCSGCHYHDRRDTKVGPGLLGLFKRSRLPDSGLPVSEEAVRSQIINGGKKMPPFKHLKPEELEAIIDYLKTL